LYNIFILLVLTCWRRVVCNIFGQDLHTNTSLKSLVWFLTLLKFSCTKLNPQEKIDLIINLWYMELKACKMCQRLQNLRENSLQIVLQNWLILVIFLAVNRRGVRCTHLGLGTILKFWVHVGISKITEGNGLKHHTLISDHNRSLLSKAHNIYIDFDRIMAIFEPYISTLLRFLFHYQVLRIISKVKHAVLTTAHVYDSILTSGEIWVFFICLGNQVFYVRLFDYFIKYLFIIICNSTSLPYRYTVSCIRLELVMNHGIWLVEIQTLNFKLTNETSSFRSLVPDLLNCFHKSLGP
jgi:hypothetical protein